MAKTVVLMEREGSSPAIFWTTKLVAARQDDGSLSLWVIEDSAFGQVTHRVVANATSPEEINPVLLSLSDWSDLRIGYDDIVGTIGPRLAVLDAHLAEAVKQEAGAKTQPAVPQRNVA